MRLKNLEGSISYHNGNNDILNSPKRINTIQNSNISVNYNNATTNSTITNNYTSSYENSLNSNLTTSNVITNVENLNTADLNILNQGVHDKVRKTICFYTNWNNSFNNFRMFPLLIQFHITVDYLKNLL